MKKSLIVSAIAAGLGIGTNTFADTINLDWTGAFTMVTPPDGGILLNPSSAGGTGINDDAFGLRSTITGTMSFDTSTGNGSAVIDPILFSGNFLELNFYADLSFTSIGDGLGGAGSLILASSSLGWAGTGRSAYYMVADMAGLLNTVTSPGTGVGSVIDGGTTSTSDVAVAASAFGPLVGEICSGGAEDGGATGCPFAMTTLDVNQDATGALVNGGFPLSDDGISGTPMATGAFLAHNVNIDITEMTVISIVPEVPLPAAFWLFGSGLLGLIHVARRKSHS